jgi:nucleoside-diphosphate-sugar epimerase
MKRIIITGATGFLGEWTIPFLHDRGFEIHTLGRTPPKQRQIEFHQVDILDAAATQLVTGRVRASHLLHLAWNVSPGYWQAAANIDWVSASLCLVRSFEAAGGRRAVLAGTCAEYRWGSPRFFETTPCCPQTVYGTAKDALRRLLLTYYGSAKSLTIGWGRIFFLYGPRERSGRLVADAVSALLAGTPFPTSHGRQRRDFMYVEDAAAAFAALIDCDVQGPVNIGSGHAVSVRSLLNIIAAEIGNAECLRFGERALSEDEPHVIEADVTRLAREVGFQPRYNLRSGIAETIASRQRDQGGGGSK